MDDEKKKSSVRTNDHLNFFEENVISLLSGNFKISLSDESTACQS